MPVSELVFPLCVWLNVADPGVCARVPERDRAVPAGHEHLPVRLQQGHTTDPRSLTSVGTNQTARMLVVPHQHVAVCASCEQQFRPNTECDIENQILVA